MFKHRKHFVLCIVILLLCGLATCNRGHEYNFGIAATSLEFLTNAKIQLHPKGEVPFGVIKRGHGGWLRRERHWPVPQKLFISFRDPSGNYHEFQPELSLSKRFRGDILAVIYKENDQYQVKIITGKLDKLDDDQIIREQFKGK